MEKMKEFFARLNSRAGLVSVVFLLVINLYVIFSSRQYVSWDWRHTVSLLVGNLLFGLLCFLLSRIYSLAKRLPTFSEEKINRLYRWTLIALALAVFLIPLLLVIHVPDSAHNWDYFHVFNNTTALHGRDWDDLKASSPKLQDYFLHYNFMQFFLVLYNWITTPFAGNVLAKAYFLTVLSGLFTSVAVVGGSFLTKSLGNKSLALLYNVAAFGFLPFYFYGAEMYTDTASLPFVVLSALFFVYALKANTFLKEILWWLAGGVFVSLGYTMKATGMIVLIATGIFLIFQKRWKKLLLMLLCVMSMYALVDHLTVIVADAREGAGYTLSARKEFAMPTMHWIAMSWDPNNPNGGYYKPVYDYTTSYSTMAERNAADKKLFFANLKKMGAGGVMRQIFRKLRYTWTFGDLKALFYTYRHENGFIYHFFDWDSKVPKAGNITGYLWLQVLANVYWIFLVALMCFEIFLSLFKRTRTLWFIPALSIVGLTSFLILWEANARYLYNFAPIMIGLAVLGMMDFLAGRGKPYALDNETL